MTLFVRFMNKSHIRRLECNVVTISDDYAHVGEYDGETYLPLKLSAVGSEGSEQLDDICDIEVY